MKLPIYITILLAFLVNDALSNPRGKNGFCKGKALTGGKQNRDGSCSTTDLGQIPAANKMTSTLITFPQNEARIEANKVFEVKVSINNLETGFFSDPDKKYFSIPQELADNGCVKGHTHITIQKIDGKSVPNAQEFAFFEGLNDKAKDGHNFSVDVAGKDGSKGLPPGKYRICTMSSSFSHQPLVMPIAKRGAQDDCIRISVVENESKPKRREAGYY